MKSASQGHSTSLTPLQPLPYPLILIDELNPQRLSGNDGVGKARARASHQSTELQKILSILINNYHYPFHYLFLYPPCAKSPQKSLHPDGTLLDFFAFTLFSQVRKIPFTWLSRFFNLNDSHSVTFGLYPPSGYLVFDLDDCEI